MFSENIELISIEGNIGSGKSTLLANLKKVFGVNKITEANFVFLDEPVSEWSHIKDENGTTILEKFYADQEKYSFSFQMMAYISRLNLLKEAFDNSRKNTDSCSYKTYIITERSLLTDKMVFAKMLYDNGKIEPINYQIYLKWFDVFSKEFPIQKVIYVKTNPENCFQRVEKRHRDGEDKIPLEYLISCDNYHNNMLDKSNNDCICNKQLILDGNLDIYTEKGVKENWIDRIEKFILFE